MTVIPDIQTFFAQSRTFGFSKKYNFQISNITNAPVPINAGVLLYAQSTSVPSRGINTTKVPYKAFDFVVPTNANFPDQNQWKITFFSDDKQYIRSLFEAWSNALYDPLTNQSTGTIANDAFNGFTSCNLDLDLLSENKAKVIRTYKLQGVFPTLIEGVEYDISDTGTNVVKLTVILAFQYFTVTA